MTFISETHQRTWPEMTRENAFATYKNNDKGKNLEGYVYRVTKNVVLLPNSSGWKAKQKLESMHESEIGEQTRLGKSNSRALVEKNA